MRFREATAGALAAAACVLAVAACGSQSAQGATAEDNSVTTAGHTQDGGVSNGGVSSCQTAQLKITLGHTGALGGQAGGYLRFANDSHTTCRISGWPIVTGLTASGKGTTLRHARSTMFGAWQYTLPLPVLTLSPGESAYAVVAADDLPVGRQTRCPAPDVRLRVGAPGSKGTVLVSAWLPGAGSYLPTCTSISGSPTGETSAITSLAKLPH
jgi:hypothetical protein